MRKTCNLNCQFAYDIDLFGKEAELYYMGKSKRTSCIGIFFTFFYIAMYIAFFLYQLIRMVKKEDVTFYDTYAYTGEPPNIQLTKEKFYGGFALGNPLTLQTFVDDSIYFVKAFFRIGYKNGSTWEWQTIPLEIEDCKLESFGEEYRDIFKDKSVDQLHCVPLLNHKLQGHLTYDVYSYYYVKFYPCVLGVNSDKCKPLDIVKTYLNQTFVTFKMEDVDLTPQLYHSPVALRGKEVSANVGAALFQDVHSFFQVINIETDEDILGFEVFSQIKKEKYIKYDQSVILSSLKQDIFKTGDAICDVTIALSEQELTQKRTYPKLIQVLGDVGGLMEVFFSLFRIISSFLTDVLYETSLVNNLFSFDLEKKVLLIKENKNQKKLKFLPEDAPQIYAPLNKQSNQNSLINDMSIQTRNKLNDEMLSKTKFSNEKLLVNKAKKKKRKKIKNKTKISASNFKMEKEEQKNEKEFEINSPDNIKECNIMSINICNSIEERDGNKAKDKDTQYIESRRGSDKKKEEGKIIHRIRENKFCTYCCFLCIRKRKNMQNVLLDEGMKVITEKLDIFNLFKKIYRAERLQEIDNLFEDYIEMSDECKQNLLNLYKK